MDNRIHEIRKQIRALRTGMLEAEAVMREQITKTKNALSSREKS